MRKSIINLIIIFIIGAIGGIFANQILWPYFVERPFFNEYRLERAPVYLTETKEIYIEENNLIVDSFEKIEKSVVGIKSISQRGATIEGSGIVLTNDGLILTFEDLIPQGYDFYFHLNGKNLPYQVLKRDAKLNLALVKLEGDDFLTFGFKSKDSLKKGEKVFLTGFLFFKDYNTRIINSGIIKNIDDNYIYTNIIEDNKLKGSVLFSVTGEIIGINLINKNKEIITISSDKIREFIGF